jgi:hypothetical protein
MHASFPSPTATTVQSRYLVISCDWDWMRNADGTQCEVDPRARTRQREDDEQAEAPGQPQFWGYKKPSLCEKEENGDAGIGR